MKVLVFLSIIFITGLTSQVSNAHPGHELSDEFLDTLTCSYKDVEGVWRINTTGKQASMNSGGYLSFARSNPSATPPPDEMEFVVTGNGFGKLENTPVFFKGSCEAGDSGKIYVLKGTIEVGGNLQTVTVTPHAVDEFSDQDDDCDGHGQPDPKSICKLVAHKYQTRFIAIHIDGTENTKESAKGEMTAPVTMDPGNGHAHGGGSN